MAGGILACRELETALSKRSVLLRVIHIDCPPMSGPRAKPKRI